MRVAIKSFDVGMEVKSKGIEFEVDSPDGTEHIGDVVLTMTGLIWCKGRTSRNGGIKISWKEFYEWAESRISSKRKKK